MPLLQAGMRKCLTVTLHQNETNVVRRNDDAITKYEKKCNTRKRNMKQRQIACAVFHLPCTSTLIRIATTATTMCAWRPNRKKNTPKKHSIAFSPFSLVRSPVCFRFHSFFLGAFALSSTLFAAFSAPHNRTRFNLTAILTVCARMVHIHQNTTFLLV